MMRTTVALLGLALAVGALTGCGAEEVTDAECVELWNDAEQRPAPSPASVVRVYGQGEQDDLGYETCYVGWTDIETDECTSSWAVAEPGSQWDFRPCSEPRVGAEAELLEDGSLRLISDG